MHAFGNLILSGVVVFLVLGGPLTLYAIVKILNAALGGLNAKILRSPSTLSEAPLGLLVDWDEASYPLEICRVRLDFSELIPGGRATSFSFTFEDKSAKKRSFMIPMKLKAEDFAMLTDAATPRAVKHSNLLVEIEDVKGEVVRKKIPKAQVLKALAAEAPLPSQDFDLVPQMAPDAWSVLTRVFPWRKVVAVAAADAKPAHEKKAAKGPAAPTLVDFIVTRVWIEPGCIVCDACENEAPAVFQVLPDTCIVRENAPLEDGGSIKAAAEGCPVDVIKYTTVPKSA